MAIDYNERIPNNVALPENRRLQRALESWQPSYLRWWNDLGPEGTQDVDVYLRTAISVESDGWAHFTYVKMPDYRWGIFLAQPQAERTISFGDHLGEPVWQEIPGEYRSLLRRLGVGAHEPAILLRSFHRITVLVSFHHPNRIFKHPEWHGAAFNNQASKVQESSGRPVRHLNRISIDQNY